ncbi:MAG: pbs lyase heat-like repeat protein [Acidobacteriaceae bacterium]|nr:pbs lyase heat-like repeat protein [Acidobacteriaceae bacterium]
MPFIEDLGMLVLWLIAMVMSMNFVFMFFVFYRRLSRARYFAEKDAARARYEGTINRFVGGELSTEDVTEALESATSPAEQDVIEALLLKQVDGTNADRVSELFFSLGFVDRWAKITFGRKRSGELVKRALRRERATIDTGTKRSILDYVSRMQILAVPRALALNSLGRMAPEHSEVFLAEGLKDPSMNVRRVAIESMGRNRFPQAVPLLLEELRKAIEEGNDVSLRTMKSALICYNLEDLDLFIPYLTHPARRVRFFVIDTLREICNKASDGGLLAKNDFSPALCRLILEKVVNDEFADVRARSAWLVRHFRDDQAVEALQRLLNDENEFVRLHAVRACGNRTYSTLIPEIVARLTDTRWRVREAAVGTLALVGAEGLDEMYRFFVTCPDAFACEQITEEIQRKGLVQDLVSALMAGGEETDLGRAVCQKMAMMGKTSLLISALASVVAPEVRIALMESLAAAPNDEFLSVLQMITETSSGSVQIRASQILYQSSARALSSAAGAS